MQLPWIRTARNVAATVIVCACAACGGSVSEAPPPGAGHDAGSDGSCVPNCPEPPPGCKYVGTGSCEPPMCPLLQCVSPDAGDAALDATCAVACPSPPYGCHYVGQPTCDPPTCPPLECIDAGQPCEIDCGAPPPGCHFEGEPTCEPPACPPLVCDEGGTFPGALDGVWLFGWSGGMNHFSWVRLRIEQMGGGGAQFLSGADLSYNIPFWDCSGQGDWMLTAKPDTIGLYFPEGCALGFQAYTFLSLQPPSSTFPKGAILEATVEGLGGPGQIMQVYKFPAWQCDEAMTACQDPLH